LFIDEMMEALRGVAFLPARVGAVNVTGARLNAV
jgi:hypothetical protein